MFQEQELNTVYLKVEELFKTKLKRQIIGSGLIFKRLLRVHDLVSETEYFQVKVNERSFTFSNLSEFYSGFLNLIKDEYIEIKKEIELNVNYRQDDFMPDKQALFLAFEKLYDRESKLDKITKRINQYTESLKTI